MYLCLTFSKNLIFTIKKIKKGCFIQVAFFHSGTPTFLHYPNALSVLFIYLNVSSCTVVGQSWNYRTNVCVRTEYSIWLFTLLKAQALEYGKNLLFNFRSMIAFAVPQ